MFQVGQRVVCVDVPWESGSHPLPWVCPTLKSIYVVRDIVPWANGRGSSFRFSEIRNQPIDFSTEYFRPVVDRATDISVFTALLTPTRERAPA